jgi:hypothetical protein
VLTVSGVALSLEWALVLRAAGGSFAVGRCAIDERVDLGQEPVSPDVVSERSAEICRW